MPVLILSVILAYCLVWAAVSWLSGRGADNATFFSGNRKMAWPLVAIAMIGAPITGVTFISVPGMVLTKGYSYMQMCLGFVVGYLVIAYVLIPLYYRLNIVSIYGYLQKRFGTTSRQTGAWLFFVSKIVGVSVRFLVVCTVLQLLVFEPLGIPYVFCIVTGLLLVWLSTVKGGVKSVIWGDTLKSVCLIAAIVLSMTAVTASFGLDWRGFSSMIADHPSSRIFFFDDPSDGRYFWKQFIAGIFIVVAMTGLDQDMMQRALACRDARASRKNLITASIMQVAVISLLLVLGTVLSLYLEQAGEPLPEKSDNLFAAVAFHGGMPSIVGAVFIIGLVSATFSSVASALTSMTTTMTIDIMGTKPDSEPEKMRRRKRRVHTAVAAVMGILVAAMYYLSKDDAISTVYTLISYTDGPILGLFLFGILTKRAVSENLIPYVCILSPIFAWALKWSAEYFLAFTISYELLLFNAAFTFFGMMLISSPWGRFRTGARSVRF